MWWVGFPACEPDGAGPGRQSTDDPVSVGATASCEATDNALRFQCTAELDLPAEGVWTLSRNGEIVRTVSTPSGNSHTVVLYGMVADTDYDWALAAGSASATGTLRTGPLPSDFDLLTVTASGDGGPVSAVLVPQSCNGASYLIVVDDDGEPIWYEAAGLGGGGPGGGIQGATWTEDGTFLWSYGQTDVVEMTPDGARLWQATGFDRPLHHDVNKGGGLVYVLNASEHDGVVVDGLYVLRDGALVAEWDLYDHVEVSADGTADPFWWGWFPGSEDWSHANSVWSDGVRGVVSLRWQDAILEIVADPDAADFGAITSTLVGTSSDLTSDFAWTDGGDFDGQHHVTPVEGGYALFDNQGMSEDSRALLLDVDTAAGTVREGESWSLDLHCDIQGAAYPLEDGGLLATCATEGRVFRYTPGNPDPVWEMTASCGSAGGPASLARGVPVPW